jgi:hypothetical protein
MVFLPETGTSWFVHLVGGHAELKDTTFGALAAGESLLLEPDASGRSRVLTGGGEVVLVKLMRR